jgi:formylglycine-generating enzyme required for sulfatase activity
LCTRDEWSDACNGTSSTDAFPYGATYTGSTCNGSDYSRPPAYPTTIPTGDAAACASDLGGGVMLFDMSGNVKEWVETSAGSSTHEIRGGAYNSLGSPGGGVGLRCDAFGPAPASDIKMPSIGFRCCHSGMVGNKQTGDLCSDNPECLSASCVGGVCA